MSQSLAKTDLTGQSMPKEQKTLLIFGDSLSAAYGIAPNEGWVYLLEQRLVKKDYIYQVINASISGDTTSGGLSRLSKTLQQHKPEIVVLELGANDGLRGLNLKTMRQNLATMIEKSQQAKAKVLLLGMKIPANYGKTYTDSFHQIYLDLAAFYKIPMVPFFLEGVALNTALIQDDGLHPNAKAQERLLENVWETLKKLLEK